MARSSKRKDCHNCPDTDEPEPIQVVPFPRQNQNHGAQLWQQAMFTCSSVLEMLHGYSITGVAGDNIQQLHRLSERLTQIIQNCEKRNADPSTPQ